MHFDGEQGQDCDNRLSSCEDSHPGFPDPSVLNVWSNLITPGMDGSLSLVDCRPIEKVINANLLCGMTREAWQAL